MNTDKNKTGVLLVLSVFIGVYLGLVPVSLAETPPPGEYAHEFVCKPEGNPSRVNVAGEFNNWSTDATPMKRGEDGVWHVTVNLPEGIQHYKFVVDGNQWKNDPTADKSLEVNDNNGGVNSGVVIGPDARKFPPPKPDDINTKAVLFDPFDPNDLDVFDRGKMFIRVRTQAGDVQHVAVQLVNPRTNSFPLDRLQEEQGFDVWAGIAESSEKQMRFYISLADGARKGWIGGNHVHQIIPHVSEDPVPGMPPFEFTIDAQPKFQTPDWSKHAIWYQTFPERFRNGDTANDPDNNNDQHMVRWTSDWWKTQPGEAPGAENFYKGKGNVWKRRYGGDVQGLIWALPYLRKLGVNAIYLNPIFEADSMHKYDTSDYRHVDDNFGFKGDIAQLKGETDDPATWQWTKTDKLFLDFVADAHRMGFKVILDGVFNHVGRDFWAFQDVLKNGKKSKYAGWFEIRDWNPPIKYIAWDTGSEPTDHGALPVFKKDPVYGLAPGPRKHVLAIVKRWLAPDGDPSRGVDGFRLDVPGDIPHPFWIEFRKVVKQTKPDAFIAGEIWTWAQPWLNKGDQFDAVMNYRFAEAAQQFFVNQKRAISPTQFNAELDRIAYSYPFQVALCQMNLFDSHDTDRFASMFVNPDLPYDGANRIQDNGPHYSPAKPTPLDYTRMEQAVAMQMSFVGAPMIYYGDETGMWGPDDPSNRQPMTWPGMKFDDPRVGFNSNVFASYQRAIAVRTKLPELETGIFHGIVEDDAEGVYAFARDLGDEHAYVVLNRSDQPRVITLPAEDANGTKLIDWLNPEQTALVQPKDARPMLEMKPDFAPVRVVDGKIAITLKPFGTAVLSRGDAGQ